MTRVSDRKPYFFMYADDFISGVLGMPDVDVGVYIKLLCLAWSKDGVSDMEAQSVTRDDSAISRVLNGKFERHSDGRWRNKKQEQVRAYAEAKSKAGQSGGAPDGNDNAKKQTENKQNSNQKTSKHTNEKQTPNPYPEPYPESREPEPNPVSPQTPQGVSCDEFVDRWNNFVAKRPKLKAVRKATGKRREKIKARLKDPGWFDDFREGILSLPLPGDGWQPDLDWLVRNDHNIYLLLEGAFDWRGKDDPAAQRLAARRRQEAYERRQQEEAIHKQQLESEKSGTHKAINATLNRATGEPQGTGAGSLLFGLEGDSCANGAGRSSRHPRGVTERSGRQEQEGVAK